MSQTPSNMLLIKGVIFDLGNTLVAKKDKKVLKKMRFSLAKYLNNQFNIDIDDCINRWKQSLHEYSMLKQNQQYGYILEKTTEAFLRELLSSYGFQNVDKHIIDEAISCYHQERINTVQVFPQVLEMIKILRGLNYRLAIVSNAADTSKQKKIITTLDLHQYFDPIIISADVGFRKPDSRIFRLVLDNWSLNPSEVVVVGNSLNADIIGAKRMGMYSILIDANGSMENSENNNLTSIIPSKILKDIADVGQTIEQLAIEVTHQPYHRVIYHIGYIFNKKKTAKFIQKEVMYHPYREDVVFKAIDLDIPLESQGPFHIILHKVTDQLVRNNDHDQQQLKNLSQYLSLHPEILCAEPIDKIYLCLNRRLFSDFLSSLSFSLPLSLSAYTVKYPLYQVISNTDNLYDFKNAIQKKGFNFPLICKPEKASGPGAHAMLIINHPEGLNDIFHLEKVKQFRSIDRWVVQEYINHNAAVFKVYILGDFIGIALRDSLPNLFPHQSSSNCIVYDSQKPISNSMYDLTFVEDVEESEVDTDAKSPVLSPLSISSQKTPKLKLSPFPFSSLSLSSSSEAMLDSLVLQHNYPSSSSSIPLWINEYHNTDSIPLINRELIGHISQILRQQLDLQLFGYDVIIEENTGYYYIIDINYFPSYKEMNNFNVRLLSFLLSAYHQNLKTQLISIDDVD